MFALAHKETGKFVGWDVFASNIDGVTDYCLTEPEFSNNVWCLLSYMDAKRILDRGEIQRGVNTFYSDPDVDFSLDEYEIVVLTGVKV